MRKFNAQAYYQKNREKLIEYNKKYYREQVAIDPDYAQKKSANKKKRIRSLRINYYIQKHYNLYDVLISWAEAERILKKEELEEDEYEA